MTQQRLNPFTAGPQVGQRGDQVEARGGKVAGESGVGRHDAMVAAAEVAMEGNGPAESLAIARNSEGEPLRVVDMEDAYKAAIAADGLIDKEAADKLNLSAGQLSRQLRSEPNYHLSCQRLTLLSRAAHVAYVQKLAQRLGMDLVVADQDALAIGEMLQAIGRAMPRFRMARATLVPPVRVERRRA